MAKRKKTTSGKAPVPVDRQLVLVGDVRPMPIEIKQEGRVFRPDVAIWANPANGRVVGTQIGPPGSRAQLLRQALLEPNQLEESLAQPSLPGIAAVFDEALAAELASLLAPYPIEIRVAEPIPEFEEIFAALFGYLAEGDKGNGTIRLPDEVLKPLVTVAERLWRAKPWEYSYDNPPYAIIPQQPGARAFYASILGARMEVFGVALYSSLEDYQRTLARGDVTILTPSGVVDEAANADALLQELQQRSYLVSFDLKDDVMPSYRDQLAGAGWSRRFSVVPTFGAIGGEESPGEPTADEVRAFTPALDALGTFCQRHRNTIAREDFPIQDQVEVKQDEQAMVYQVSVGLDEERRRS